MPDATLANFTDTLEAQGVARVAGVLDAQAIATLRDRQPAAICEMKRGHALRASAGFAHRIRRLSTAWRVAMA